MVEHGRKDMDSCENGFRLFVLTWGFERKISAELEGIKLDQSSRKKCENRRYCNILRLLYDILLVFLNFLRF